MKNIFNKCKNLVGKSQLSQFDVTQR